MQLLQHDESQHMALHVVPAAALTDTRDRMNCSPGWKFLDDCTTSFMSV